MVRSPRTSGGLREELKQGRPFRSAGAEAFVAVLRTADLLRRRMSATVEPHGITLQQYNVLRILRGAHPEPLPTLEIRERLIEQAPGITRLLDHLDAQGLVRRERCAEDRRQVHCWITETGLALLAGTDAEVDAADEALVADLDDEEVRALLDHLQSVREAARSG